MTVLLDTGVLFAFVNRRDARHGQARQLLQSVARQRYGRPTVLDHVVAETFTLLRAREAGVEAERRMRSLLLASPPLLPRAQVLSLGSEGMPMAWTLFDRYRDQHVSFVDAAQLAACERFDIERLATFDRTLGRLGRPPPDADET